MGSVVLTAREYPTAGVRTLHGEVSPPKQSTLCPSALPTSMQVPATTTVTALETNRVAAAAAKITFRGAARAKASLSALPFKPGGLTEGSRQASATFVRFDRMARSTAGELRLVKTSGLEASSALLT